MKLLGIDSSGLVASAAVLADDVLVGEFTVNNKQTHSQTLLPMIEKVVAQSGIVLEEIDAIAVASGPGSFTGLRIGAATVKGLGLALNKPIVSVPTLEGLAFRLAGIAGLVCPIMDARRNQVYTGIYRVSAEGLETVVSQRAVDIHEIIGEAMALGEPVTFLGDGVEVHRETITENYHGEFHFAPVHLSKQSAASVVALGKIYYEQGKIESADQHKPEYLRKSQAEREREEREKEAKERVEREKTDREKREKETEASRNEEQTKVGESS